VLTLASIRPGEEAIWFKAIQNELPAGAELNVIVAPRHREKFDYFAQQLSVMDFSWTRWSSRQRRSNRNGVQFILLDTFGDLERVFSFSDAAFVGGSLVDFGGHNPLEAAAYGCFVCMGPYTSNVKEVVEDLVNAQAFRSINTDNDACALVVDLVSNLDSLKTSGSRGIAVWQQHRGATDRILSRLEDLFKVKPKTTSHSEVVAQLG
jgi:3-deoxy-D-manno-octulosonic-acid transferase